MIGVLDRITRSIERPSVPLSQAVDELMDAFGARQTDSGVSVNRVTALRHPAIWRGVNLLSRDTAKLPVIVYRRQGEGKVRDAEHPAYRLLKDAPNEYMTAFVFKQTLTAHAIQMGNGYAWITRRGDARPVDLLPLLPDRTYPVRENGRLLYITSIGGTLEDNSSEVIRIPSNNMLHIKGLGYDGLCGYPLIDFGAEVIGHGLALEKFSSRFFRNSARPSIIIEHPAQLSEVAAKRLRESWDKLYAGSENAHKTAVLEEGMKANPISINARDSQLDESQKFDLIKIANLLGLPPHKVGGDGRTSYNSLEQENQAYLDEGLDPWLFAWEQECRAKLLSESEKKNDTHVIEFMRNALVRADMAARGNFYHIGLLDGWINRDEVRGRENLNPMPEGEGQKYFIPLNVKTTGEDAEAAVEDVQQTALNGAQIASMVQIVEAVSLGSIPKDTAKAMIAASFPLITAAEINAIVDPMEEGAMEPEPPPVPGAGPPEPANDSARQALLADAIGRACRVVGVWARRAAKDSKGFSEWLDVAQEKNSPAVLEILNPACRVLDFNPDTLSRTLFEDIQNRLDDCYSTKPEQEFYAAVDACMTELETTYSATLAGSLLTKGTD